MECLSRSNRPFGFPSAIIIQLLIIFQTISSARAEDVISPELIKSLSEKPAVDIVISFKERTGPNLENVRQQTKSIQDRGQKLEMISNALEELAAKTHSGLIQTLKTKKSGAGKVTFGSIWLTNQMYVLGATPQLVKEIAAADGVTAVDENIQLERDEIVNDTARNENQRWDYSDDHYAQHEISWAVAQIHAPEVWALGYDGEGIKVGIVDTGVRVTQDYLSGNYVGTSNYGWYDPMNKTKYPWDGLKHGSHCLPLAVGMSGVGVAPGAKWMACRDPQLDYIYAALCLQFMFCPTDYLGENKNCSRAPNVITNSWYYLHWKPDPGSRDWIEPFIGTDIHLVFCIGNSGKRGCNSTSVPGRYPQVIGVGATDRETKVTKFSSTGPSPDESGIIKPDLCAPGEDVLTGLGHDDMFLAVFTGCSAATPLVAGSVALMLQKNPNLSQQQVMDILRNSTAHGLPSDFEQCGDIPETEYPNHRMGYGILDVLKAVNSVPVP